MLPRARRTRWTLLAVLTLLGGSVRGDLPPRTTDGCVMLMRMCRQHCGPTWLERDSVECRERCLTLADKCMAHVPEGTPAP